jgi:hypothetical protein
MSVQNLTQLFKGEFIGMVDKDGKPIYEGDSVRFYYNGDFVTCKVIYVPDWAMFCLQWPDGYKNKFPMNPENYQVVSK